jgi:hypothetical protein
MYTLYICDLDISDLAREDQECLAIHMVVYIIRYYAWILQYIWSIIYVSNNIAAKVGIVAEYNSHESYKTDVAT